MRSKKALFNFITSLLLQFITAIIGFILPLLYIKAYGSEINGLVSSIKQFLSYLTIVEAGVGAASIAALYSPIALSDKLSINGILSATKTFYRRSGYLFIFLVVLLAFIYPLIVGDEVNSSLSLLMVLILGLSGMMEYLVIGKYQVLLTADQKSYIVNIVQITGILLNALVCIVMVKGGFTVLAVQITSTLVYISRMFFLISYVKKRYRAINYNSKPNFSGISNRWDALIHQIAGLAVFSTPIIIVTIFCGLKEVSVFAIYNMIISGVVMLVSAFSNGLMAAFGEILAKDERATLLRAFSEFEGLYYLVMTWAYTCTALLFLPFIQIYTLNIQDADYIRPIAAILFIIVGVSNSIRVPPMTLVNAAGHYTQTKYRSITEAVINITVSLALVQSLGIVGVLVGSICSYAYRTVDFILYSSRNILQRSVKYTFTKLIYNLVFASISILPFLTIFKIQAASFFEWIIWAMIIGIWVLVVIGIGNSLTQPDIMKSIFKRAKNLFQKNNKYQKIRELN
ncbi:MAG: polysaccharide transport protein [Neobacillus sp.]|jgi:O-antigen/teichoic acid export membrane protein